MCFLNTKVRTQVRCDQEDAKAIAEDSGKGLT